MYLRDRTPHALQNTFMCHKTIKCELKSRWHLWKKELSRCFVFYWTQKTKYVIIPGEMLPGRLKPGEVGHSRGVSHRSEELPVGTGWLWNT